MKKNFLWLIGLAACLCITAVTVDSQKKQFKRQKQLG